MKHYNPEIARNAARIFNAKGVDMLSDQVLGPVATIEVAPQLLVAQAFGTNTTSANVLVLPTGKRTYVYGLHLGVTKDATATSTDTSIRATINGVVTRLITIPGTTLVAQNQTASISFPYPILVDAGTTITINHSTAVANVTGSAVVYYAQEDAI